MLSYGLQGVYSYGTEGGISGHNRPNYFLLSLFNSKEEEGEGWGRDMVEYVRMPRRCFVVRASKRSHLISVLGDLTWPTESRKSQMGT